MKIDLLLPLQTCPSATHLGAHPEAGGQDLEPMMFQYRFSGSVLIDGKAGVRGGENRTFGQEFSGQFQFERSRSRSLTAPFGVLLNCKEMNL